MFKDATVSQRCLKIPSMYNLDIDVSQLKYMDLNEVSNDIRDLKSHLRVSFDKNTNF